MEEPAARARPAPARARPGRQLGDRRLALLILGPVIGGIFAIVSYPLILAIIQSLTAETGEFIGAGNYQRALQNSLLYEALRRPGPMRCSCCRSRSPWASAWRSWSSAP